MPRRTQPRHGSLGFYPRKRAREEVPRFRSWPKVEEVGLLAFYGYKAGMTHIIGIDGRKGVPTSGQEIFIPVTVIECPPLKVVAVRYYEKTPYGLRSIGEVWTENIDKYLLRKIPPIKEKSEKKELEERADEVRVVVSTQPHLTGIGKKTPEIIEVGLGGKSIDEKIEYAKSILGKEIHVYDVFKEGELVDVKAVTKGKGFQGPVRRFGIFEFGHKKEKTRRFVGSLGAWHPPRVMWTVPMAGQMGYHMRTEFNKTVIKIGKAGENITPKGGFLHYGVVRNDFIILSGSVPGPAKRLIGIRKAIRPTKPLAIAEIRYISLESKQGV